MKTRIPSLVSSVIQTRTLITSRSVLQYLCERVTLTYICVEAVLGEYSRVRKPRAQMVWGGSLKAGRTYDQNGQYGPTPDGIRKALDNMYDPVWHHDMDDDVRDIVQALRDRGDFPPGSTN